MTIPVNQVKLNDADGAGVETGKKATDGDESETTPAVSKPSEGSNSDEPASDLINLKKLN